MYGNAVIKCDYGSKYTNGKLEVNCFIYLYECYYDDLLYIFKGDIIEGAMLYMHTRFTNLA